MSCIVALKIVNRESATGCRIAVKIVTIGHEQGQGIRNRASEIREERFPNNERRPRHSWFEGLDSSLFLVLRNSTGDEVHIFKPLGATFALNEARITSSE